MLTLIQRAESYLASNVAVSGADVLIRQLLNELVEWKQTAALDRQTLEALTIQNIEYHDHIRDLEEALQIIARKKKMDATASVSMRAIAISALFPAAPEVDDPGRPVPKHGSGP